MIQSFFDHHQTFVQNLKVHACKTRHSRECSRSVFVCNNRTHRDQNEQPHGKSR